METKKDSMNDANEATENNLEIPQEVALNVCNLLLQILQLEDLAPSGQLDLNGLLIYADAHLRHLKIQHPSAV